MVTPIRRGTAQRLGLRQWPRPVQRTLEENMRIFIRELQRMGDELAIVGRLMNGKEEGA